MRSAEATPSLASGDPLDDPLQVPQQLRVSRLCPSMLHWNTEASKQPVWAALIGGKGMTRGYHGNLGDSNYQRKVGSQR